MPGNAAGHGGYRLSIIELLLQGHPGEFLPTWHEALPGSDVRHGVSDRQLMIEAAERWSTSMVLNDEERDRIRSVWLEGAYRSPLNLDTARRDELVGKLHRAVA